jgi:hypothetical protein
MYEITHLMDHYRVVARSVWNTGFWCVPELRTWDARDGFQETKKILFTHLVVAQLPHLNRQHGPAASLTYNYRVVPLDPGPVPIMIQQPRKDDRNWYWDYPLREIRAQDAELLFLDYFDWNEMGYLDFQYYRVRIEAFRLQPHLVGREALVEHQNAKVFAAVPVADSAPDSNGVRNPPR